jgi:hypothetical protein
LSKSGLVKGLITTARLPLGRLGSGGDCPNLFGGFKGINNSRINKRDVCFDNFNGINSFNVLKFYYKERMVL